MVEQGEVGSGREGEDFAAGTFDAGAELGLVGVGDGNVEIQDGAEMFYFGVIGSGEFEAEDFAAGGCFGGGMDGVAAPFDEKWKEAALVVLEVERLPLEEAAIGAFAGSGCWTFEGD